MVQSGVSGKDQLGIFATTASCDLLREGANYAAGSRVTPRSARARAWSNVLFAFGPHTVTLKVTDSQGSVGTEEVLVNVVDTTATETSITSNPTDPSGATVSGGPGDDTIDGGNGNDILRGDDGDDILIGGQGTDRLEGGNNNDTMTGNLGADAFIGGAGSDTASDFTPSQGDTQDGTVELAAAFPALEWVEVFGGYIASATPWEIHSYWYAGMPPSNFLIRPLVGTCWLTHERGSSLPAPRSLDQTPSTVALKAT